MTVFTVLTGGFAAATMSVPPTPVEASLEKLFQFESAWTRSGRYG